MWFLFSLCVSTTLGKVSDVELAVVALVLVVDGSGRTTGPWPMWWVEAKGLLRAEELTAGAGSRFSLDSRLEAMSST